MPVGATKTTHIYPCEKTPHIYISIRSDFQVSGPRISIGHSEKGVIRGDASVINAGMEHDARVGISNNTLSFSSQNRWEIQYRRMYDI
jgi:hypothetical protein